MKDFPLIKFTLYFVGGIFLDHIFSFPPPILPIILSISILLLAINYFFSKSIFSNNIIIVFAIIILGALYSQFRENEISYPFEKTRIKEAEIYGIIQEIELPDTNRIRFTVFADSLKTGEGKWSLNEKILCTLYSKSKFNFEIGNKICAISRIDIPRNKRNPGEFDYRKYLYSNGIAAVATIKERKDIEILDSSSNLFKQLIYNIRSSINQSISNLHLNKTSALLKGLLLADRSDIDSEIKENFINSGVVHILAVSGLHVGFILLIFLFLFSRLNIYLRTILTICGIILFYLITAGQPSVFRASTMAVIYLLTVLVGRDYNPFNVLAIAALVILIIKPDELFNPGFQLSFSAVLSILIFYPILRQKIQILNFHSSVVNGILLFMAVSISAQIGTMPFTLLYFHKLSLISIAANLLIIPITGFVLAVGVLTLLISVFSIYLASVFAAANDSLVYLMNFLTEFFSGLTISHINITKFTFYDGLIYYLFLAYLVYTSRFIKHIFPSILLGLLTIASFYIYTTFDNIELLPENKLSVLMIDVGQGDSFLIKFPNGKIALLDAGEATEHFDNGKRIIEPLLTRFGIDKIDYSLISHMDNDHSGGFKYLIQSGYCDTLFKHFFASRNNYEIEYEKLFSDRKININIFHKRSLRIGNCMIYILNDTTNTEYKGFGMNNLSGVIKIQYGEISFLFTGDAEKKAENIYINSYPEFLKSDILKAGHHGSNTSSSEKFLLAVQPDLALISCGLNNKFRHPSSKVIDRLQQMNINILRTDIGGAKLLVCDGESYQIINWQSAD